MRRVGAFEAKTHLSKLLQLVKAGESVAITLHGEEVARLVPAQGSGQKKDVAVAIARWKKARKGVTLGGLKVRELINQGRM
jgi:prevent-host-death family protein